MKFGTRKENKFLLEIIDSIPNPFYVIDVRDYTIKIANKMAYQGKIPEGLTCHLLTHRSNTPCDSSEHPCPLKEVLRTKRPVIVEHMHYDAQNVLKNVEVHGYPIFDADGNVVQYIETVVDITSRKEAEKALEIEREKLRINFDFIQKLIDTIPNPIYYKYAHGLYLGCNKSFEELHGRPKKEIIGKSAYDLFPNNHAEILHEDDQALLREPGVQTQEASLLYASGKIRDVIINKATFSDSDGTPAGLVGVILDITERKKIEREINFLASIIRNMPDAVCAIDPENRVVFWNKAAERMFGYTSEEILEQPVTLILPEEHKSEISHCVTSLNMTEIVPSYESIRISKDRTRFPVEVTAVPLYDVNGQITGCASITRDVRGRKKMEKEILKASKIESIGVLAGGIAHDFNNLLTAIMSSISTVKDMVPSDPDIHELLSIAQKASRNAKDLTHQLLSFARGDAPDREAGSVAELLRKAIRFVMSGSNIKYKLFIEEHLFPVRMDKTQITQVINNLALNAKDAMQEGGLLTVHAENCMIERNDNIPLKEGEYVKISISDQGTGIPEEIIHKIFDPYFSTKQMSVRKGMGLGLALCYVIIKNHDGFIAVDSTVGVGTTFTIYLPATESKEPEAQEEKRRIITGKGSVLIMDDETVIEQIAGIMFRRIGYELTFARDGAETIRLYEAAMKAGRKFDVVILDLTIPGEQGGKETVRRLLEIDGSVKAIVSSGYSEDPVMANFRSYGFKGVLPKPYEVEELSEVIAAVLREQD